MTENLQKKLNEFVFEESTCASEGCRCDEAIGILKDIANWANNEIKNELEIRAVKMIKRRKP